jgi:hypothetical protein
MPSARILKTDFVSLCSHGGPLAQVVQGLLSILSLAAIVAAFCFYGWKIGLLNSYLPWNFHFALGFVEDFREAQSVSCPSQGKTTKRLHSENRAESIRYLRAKATPVT